MEKTKLLLVVPEKLKELKEEIESIKKFNDKERFIQVSNIIVDLKEFNNYVSNYSESYSNNYVDNYNESQDIILIFESITESRANVEKAQSELLENLRKIKIFNCDIKIIVILQTEKEKDLTFINELIKLDVQDFYFINTFEKDNIAKWIFTKPKTLKDNLKYVSTEIRKPEKEVITKEVTKYIEVPVTSKEKLRTTNNIIGVVGISNGSGATSLCVNYATYLREEEYKVLLLDRTENQHLLKLKIQGQEIKACPLAEIDIEKYDYIIIDFGILAEIDCFEKVIPKSSLTDERRIERKYCNEIIVTASCLPWRMFELSIYLKHEIFLNLTTNWIFYINGEKNSLFDSYRKTIEKSRVLFIAYNYEETYFELERLIESRRKI